MLAGLSYQSRVSLPQVLGDKFVHYGRPVSGAPRYIDPDLLLNEPSVDPYIPFESRMRPMDGL
jgi:hypothetical protein